MVFIIGEKKERQWRTSGRQKFLKPFQQPFLIRGKMKKIFLAGGCFWGVQAAFDLLIGVGKTASGYCAGI